MLAFILFRIPVWYLNRLRQMIAIFVSKKFDNYRGNFETVIQRIINSSDWDNGGLGKSNL